MSAAGVVPSHTGDCGVCASGWVTYVDAAGVAVAYSCACPRGVMKQKFARPILAVLSPDEVRELWPRGVPASASTLYDQLSAAGLPPAWHPHTLETYREAFGSSVSVKRHLALAADWVEQSPDTRPDVVLFGPNGTGKTGLAVGLVQALVRRGDRPMFADARLLFGRWRDTFRDGARETESALLADLVMTPLLVVDEATAGGASEWVERTLTLIVDQRQRHRRPTVLTLNLPATDADGRALMAMEYPPMLGAAFGPALYDRLRERAQFWHVDGASRRKARGKAERSGA